MNRSLSIVLVYLLFFVSPISLSLEEIPDFTPEYTLTAVSFPKTAVVACADVSPVVRILVPHDEGQTYHSAPPTIHSIVLPKTSPFGRAPPA